MHRTYSTAASSPTIAVGSHLSCVQGQFTLQTIFHCFYCFNFETLVDTTSSYLSAGVTSLAEVSLSGPGVLEAAHQPWYELTCSWQHSAAEMAELDIKVSPSAVLQHRSTYFLVLEKVPSEGS